MGEDGMSESAGRVFLFAGADGEFDDYRGGFDTIEAAIERGHQLGYADRWITVVTIRDGELVPVWAQGETVGDGVKG